MMIEASIPLELEKYDVQKWGENIQSWINSKYGKDKIRFVRF